MNKLFRLFTFALTIYAFPALIPEVNGQTSTNFVVLHHGYHTLAYTKRQTRVISSQADYAAALAVYTNDEPHQVDFNAGRVLLVDMGPRSTGGFSIEVVSLNERIKGAVVADVQLTKPGPRCFTTQSVTNPFQFVYIPTRREILITEKLVTLDCSEAVGSETVEVN